MGGGPGTIIQFSINRNEIQLKECLLNVAGKLIGRGGSNGPPSGNGRGGTIGGRNGGRIPGGGKNGGGRIGGLKPYIHKALIADYTKIETYGIGAMGGKIGGGRNGGGKNGGLKIYEKEL